MLDRGGGSQSFDIMLRKQRNIIMLGSSMVGKTAILDRFVKDRFHDAYEPTYEKVFSKICTFGGQEVECVIKDTQGLNDQDIFRNEYGLGYHGYVLVYSIASKRSLELLEGVHTKLINLTGNPKVPRILVGNKADLVEAPRQVSAAEGRAVAERWGVSFVECSAKFNHNIDLLFETMMGDIDRTARPSASKGRSWDSFKGWLVEPHGRNGHNWGMTILRVLVVLTMVSGLASLGLGVYAAVTRGTTMGTFFSQENELFSYVLLGLGLALSLVSSLGLCGLRFKSREFLNVYSAAIAVIMVSEVVVWLILASKLAFLRDTPWYVEVILLLSLLIQSLSMGGAQFFQRLVHDFDDWNEDVYNEF